MLRTTSGILAEIVEQKKAEVAALQESAADLERRAYEHTGHVRSFMEALRKRDPAIIAEIKKASPSRGLLQANFHPAFTAHAYEAGGAACLSVLTDQGYFGGALHDLEAARAAVSVPVLRKDFTIDRLQIFEAAAHGADAILLIAAVLDAPELTSFRELAESLRLAALVEVHDADELERAIDSGAKIIGVNNRNLQTFEVTLDTSIRLSLKMPSDVVRVSESGIFTHEDIQKLQKAGYQAFLVGESLMKAGNPTTALKSLIGARHVPA